MDNKTSPCDDLFQHACGRWIATHHSENRGFSGLAAVNHAQIKAIIANESNVDVHAFYKSCVVSLVDSHDRRKRRRQQLEDAHISRTALLVKMLDPLVTVSDLPVVFALMNAQQFKVSCVLLGENSCLIIYPFFLSGARRLFNLEPSKGQWHYSTVLF